MKKMIMIFTLSIITIFWFSCESAAPTQPARVIYEETNDTEPMAPISDPWIVTVKYPYETSDVIYDNLSGGSFQSPFYAAIYIEANGISSGTYYLKKKHFISDDIYYI